MASQKLLGSSWQSKLVHVHYEGNEIYEHDYTHDKLSEGLDWTGLLDAPNGKFTKLIEFQIHAGGKTGHPKWRNLLMHHFIEIETENGYTFTIEKNQEYVLLQSCRTPEAPDIRKLSVGQKREQWKSLSKIKTDTNPKQRFIGHVLRWIYKNEQITEPYHMANSHSQHFAKKLWHEFASPTVTAKDPRATMTISSKWKQDEKFRAGCWRLCVKGVEVLRRMLRFRVESIGKTWPEWCRDNMKTVTRKRFCYDNAVKLAGDDTDIPDIDHMDITYLADILENSSLINADGKKHVKCVRESRNHLCHFDTLTVDEEKYRQVCDQLLRAFAAIVRPTFEAEGYGAERKFMTDLELTADPKACENISDEDLEKMLGEIEGLKKQLEKEKEDGGGCVNIYVKADKITREMMTAPSPPVNISDEHYRSNLDSNICAGSVFVQTDASASSTTRDRQPSTSWREADTGLSTASGGENTRMEVARRESVRAEEDRMRKLMEQEDEDLQLALALSRSEAQGGE